MAARLCLLLALPLSGMAQSGLAPIMPRLSEHFAAVPNADMLVRLMASGLSFAMIAGSLAGAMVGDRFGQRRVLIWALVVYGFAGTAGCCWVSSTRLRAS
jgi:MFS family permease